MYERDPLEDKIREIMLSRRITYQEAAKIVQSGQKGLSDFFR